MAALPDLMAREAMLAMTSGRASNMIKRTPIGHVTLSSIRPSSSLVLNVILLTASYKRSHRESKTPRSQRKTISAVYSGARPL